MFLSTISLICTQLKLNFVYPWVLPGWRGRSTALVVLCLPGNEGDCSSTITQFQSAETVDGAAHQFHKETPSGIPTFTNGHLSRKATYSGPGGHSMHSPLFKKKMPLQQPPLKNCNSNVISSLLPK